MNEKKGEEPFAILKQATLAFRADLPKLIKTHPRQWVAYRGAERIGFGPSMAELTQKCIQQGIPYKELLVRMVQPDISAARINR